MGFKVVTTVFAFLLFGRSIHAQTPVTFNEVVPIFQQNCQTCHRPGNIGPFSLLTYEESRRYAFQIRTAVQSREMPPWKPVNANNVFHGERRLTDAEIQTISQWVEDGVLEGDPAMIPPPVNFPETWSGGEPELVIQPSEPYNVTGEDDIYRCFTVPLNSASDVYVRGYEVLPGDRSIVHHVILFTDSSGASVELDAAEPGPGYNCFGGPGFSRGIGGIGGWAPGASAQMFPEGSGFRLPGTSYLVMQVHYSHAGHQHGATQLGLNTDLTRVGLYLSPTPLERISILPMGNFRFAIPAGHPNYQVSAIMPILAPVELYAIAPHMHLLGRKVVVEAWLPFLQRRQLIRIDDWDFHWQSVYNYRQPIRLPAGTILVMTAHYDNSSNNPANPSNPPVTVRFGEETEDEMHLTFMLVKPLDGADINAPNGNDQ
jgi:hypothetical protein